MAMTKVCCGYSQDRRMQEGWYDCSSLVYRMYKEAGMTLSHVAIYIGDGKMVHAANPRRGVVLDPLRTGSVMSM